MNHRRVIHEIESAHVVDTARMILVLVRQQDRIETAYPRTQHLAAEIGAGIDHEARSAVGLDHRRGAQPLVAAIGRSADFAAASDHRHALGGSRTKNRQFHWDRRYDLHLKMENQELKIRIYHPEEGVFGNSDVRINHCAPAGRSSRRTPSCGPLRAEAPARAAPRCRRALEYLSHRLFCYPSYRSARGRRKMLSEPQRRGAALRTGRLRTAALRSME